MDIHTEDIESFDSRPVKHKKIHYAQCSDKDCPRCFFLSMWVGARNSGKTFGIVKLIKHFEKHKVYDNDGNEVHQRVIVFSPTVFANPILESLKHLSKEDTFTSYSDDMLVKVVDDIRKQRDETDRYQKDLKVWKRFLKAKREEDLSAEDYFALNHMGFQAPTPPKFPFGVCNHLVFDDLLGSACFKSVGKSAMNQLCLKNRHLQCNIYIATQSLRQCPKALRNNCNLFALWRFANKKMVLNDLFEEVSGILTPEQFEQVYDFATQGDHDHLTIDATGDKANMLRRNFDTRIVIPATRRE
jgi:hypothetical protein